MAAELEVSTLVVNSKLSQSEYDNGNSGSSKTIDWNNGNKQVLTLTANCTLSFTDISLACYTTAFSGLLLRLVQDTTGSRTVTWPSGILWPQGVPPTLSTGSGDVDLVHFFCRDDTYYGTYATDFS